MDVDLILDYAPGLRPFLSQNDKRISSPMYQLVPDVEDEENNSDETKIDVRTYYKIPPSPCVVSKRVGDIDRQATLSPGGFFAFTNILATGVGGVATTSTLDSVSMVLDNAMNKLENAEATVASFISSAAATAAAAAAAAATVSFRFFA